MAFNNNRFKNNQIFNDYGKSSEDQEIINLKKKLSFAESSLCIILTAIKDKKDLDFTKSGITSKELVDWYKSHIKP